MFYDRKGNPWHNMPARKSTASHVIGAAITSAILFLNYEAVSLKNTLVDTWTSDIDLNVRSYTDGGCINAYDVSLPYNVQSEFGLLTSRGSLDFLASRNKYGDVYVQIYKSDDKAYLHYNGGSVRDNKCILVWERSYLTSTAWWSLPRIIYNSLSEDVGDYIKQLHFQPFRIHSANLSDTHSAYNLPGYYRPNPQSARLSYTLRSGLSGH